jgi:hypothetical protein
MTSARVRWLVAIAAVLLMVLDFSQRVHVPRNIEARDADSFAPADVASPVAVTEVSKDLADWFPGLQPLATGSGKDGEEQTDWVLTLLAVFSDRQASFAVVRATPSNGGASKLERVAEGDELYGLRVTRIQPLQVRLEGDKGVQDLQVFRPSGAAGTGTGAAGGADQSPGLPAAQGPAPAMTIAAPAARAAAAPVAQQQPLSTTASPAGPQEVAAQELQPGDAFELPPSMRGMKVFEPPILPQKPAAPGNPSGTKPPPPAKKP